ncbi:MAG: hypothetical protein R3320_14205 [Nitriliruptorales bacterium]|nr:hypothetical protein [Nitriliruptorales bacterium]
MQRNLYTYTYVRRPFDDVARLLAEDPSRILQPATERAAGEARTLRSELSVELGRFEVGRDITIEVGEFEPLSMLAVALPLRWEAETAEALFPSMEATLELQALSLRSPLTQLTLIGSYEPPLGLLGAAGDALLGKRVAEAAVHRFVCDVADRIELALRQESPVAPV